MNTYDIARDSPNADKTSGVMCDSPPNGCSDNYDSFNTSTICHLLNTNSSTFLNLREGLLHRMPKDMTILQNILCLDLSYNDLATIPMALSEMTMLRYLNLSHNNMTTIPALLYQSLQFLRILDISHNKIKTFSNPPTCMTNLIEINLCHNSLNTIPKWIFDTKCQVQKLDISSNPLNEINKDFLSGNIYLKFISKLSELNIENCRLNNERLHFISNIISLQTLRIGNDENYINSVNKNHIDGINVDIFKSCINLKNIFAKNVGISLLPGDFGNLKCIQYLDLSNNLLTWLPDSFCDLHFLEVCKLSSNLIYFLPSNFGNLKNLKEIYLNNNNISELPDSFQFLQNMEYCDLYNNKLEAINPGIIDVKSLKGIDLERNCLDLSIIYNDQQLCDEFTSKYELLKEHYRQRFRCERDDLQTAKSCDNSSEGYSKSSSQESDSRPNLLPEEDFEPENWDEEDDTKDALLTPIDDEFDPNVNIKPIGKLKTQVTNSFLVGNFCPADYNALSWRVDALHSEEDQTVDGQYDSD